MKKTLAIFMTLLLLLLAGCSPEKKETVKYNTLSTYDLDGFTKMYNRFANGREEEELKSEAWKDGTRKSFQTFRQVIGTGMTIEVMVKDNVVIGVLLITPYGKDIDSNRYGVVLSIMAVADGSLFKANSDKEPFNKIKADTKAEAFKSSLTNAQAYESEYDGYVYKRIIHDSTKNDYFLIINKDYYDEYHS